MGGAGAACWVGVGCRCVDGWVGGWWVGGGGGRSALSEALGGLSSGLRQQPCGSNIGCGSVGRARPTRGRVLGAAVCRPPPSCNTCICVPDAPPYPPHPPPDPARLHALLCPDSGRNRCPAADVQPQPQRQPQPGPARGGCQPQPRGAAAVAAPAIPSSPCPRLGGEPPCRGRGRRQRCWCPAGIGGWCSAAAAAGMMRWPSASLSRRAGSGRRGEQPPRGRRTQPACSMGVRRRRRFRPPASNLGILSFFLGTVSGHTFTITGTVHPTRINNIMCVLACFPLACLILPAVWSYVGWEGGGSYDPPPWWDASHHLLPPPPNAALGVCVLLTQQRL